MESCRAEELESEVSPRLELTARLLVNGEEMSVELAGITLRGAVLRVSAAPPKDAELELLIALEGSDLKVRVPATPQMAIKQKLRLSFGELPLDTLWPLFGLLAAHREPARALKGLPQPSPPRVRLSEGGTRAAIDVDPVPTELLADARFLLERVLAEARINDGVDCRKIEAALLCANHEGQRQSQVEVAFAVPALMEAQAGIEFQFELAGKEAAALSPQERKQHELEGTLLPKLVRQGDLLCVRAPKRNAQPGKTLSGAVIEPPPGSQWRVRNVKMGPNTIVGSMGRVLCEIYCGYADYMGGVVRVSSPVRVSRDQMHVALVLHPCPRGGEPLTRKDVELLLKEQDVCHGVDWAAIDSALATPIKRATKVEIARGTEAQPGTDGRLEFKVDIAADSVRSVTANTGGFAARKMGGVVSRGDLLCEYIPATAGVPTTDVFGNAKPAIPGKELEMDAGLGVRRVLSKYLATSEGTFVVEAGSMSVREMLLIDGDVGPRSGHVRAPRAEVRVTGAVLDGYDVSAQGLIYVAETVGDASLRAFGDIEVSQGVVQRGRGLFQAGGSVTAGFARNACIRAGGDISLGASAMGCDLMSAGQVLITRGKGALIGGTTRARGGVVVNTLGAESSVETTLYVGPNALTSYQEELQVELLAVEEKLKEQDSLSAYQKEEYEKQCSLLKTKLAEVPSPAPGQVVHSPAKLIVKQKIFAGVTIHLDDVTLEVKTPRGGCQIFLSPGGRLKVVPLAKARA